MRFLDLLDRTVVVIPREVTGTNGHGNDILADGTPIEDVPAAREPLELSHRGEREDTLVERWAYTLPATVDGEALGIDGHAVIEDDGARFELDGEPDRVPALRGGGVHHIEADVYRVGVAGA